MKKSTIILTWGIGTGVASALFYQILYATGKEDSGLRWLNLLIVFLGLFIGTMMVRDKAQEGYMTYGQGFKTGFLMTLLITVISLIALIVDLQIHPDLVDKILAKAQNDMINKGANEQQIEMSMHYTRMMTTPVMLCIWTIVGGIFMGTILSLITAGVNTKKKPFMQEDDEVTGSGTQA
jgi:hypothetical protein